MKQFDIFISYRREGGADTAKHLRDTLTEKGYKVFLDIESLRSGQFNTELYRVIENSKDVLLILPAGGLDRCADENDWVRLEIEHAKKCEKNIVPIFLKGFSFPEFLPESLDFLRTQNGLAANTDYYEAFVGHLEQFLHSKHRIPKGKRWIPAVISVVLVIALSFGLIKYFTSYPHNAKQRNLVSQVTVFMSLNLKVEDLACSTYQGTLDKAIAFLQGKSLYSYEDINDMLENAKTKINNYKNDFTPLSSELAEELNESRFDKAELVQTVPALENFLDYYLARLEFFSTYLTSIYTMPVTTDAELNAFGENEKVVLLNMLNNEREMSELFSEELFYNTNLIFLNVNVESALKDFKSETLPEMSTIYAKRLDFLSDKDVIEGKLDNLAKKEFELTEKLQEDSDKLKDLWQSYLSQREQ